MMMMIELPDYKILIPRLQTCVNILNHLNCVRVHVVCVCEFGYLFRLHLLLFKLTNIRRKMYYIHFRKMIEFSDGY